MKLGDVWNNFGTVYVCVPYGQTIRLLLPEESKWSNTVDYKIINLIFNKRII